MASLTQWIWVWLSSRSWWWTGKSGVLQSTGSKRVGHDWTTELNGSKLWAVWKGQDRTWTYRLHKCSACLGPIHPPRSAWTLNLHFGYRRSAGRPQKPPPALQGLPLSRQGLALLDTFLHICLPVVRLQSKNEQDGAWGLLQLCWVGHWGPWLGSLGRRTQSRVGWKRLR